MMYILFALMGWITIEPLGQNDRCTKRDWCMFLIQCMHQILHGRKVLIGSIEHGDDTRVQLCRDQPVYSVTLCCIWSLNFIS